MRDSLQEGITKNQSNKIMLLGIIAVILLVKILHVSRILTVILALGIPFAVFSLL
jgi:hypothetical protein